MAAAILTQNGHENTEIALNAGISYSFDDVAAAYATALGVPVSYTDISRDDYIAERVAAGWPPSPPARSTTLIPRWKN